MFRFKWLSGSKSDLYFAGRAKWNQCVSRSKFSSLCRSFRLEHPSTGRGCMGLVTSSHSYFVPRSVLKRLWKVSGGPEMRGDEFQMSDQGASTTASVLGLRAGGLDCSVQLGLHRSTALRATPGAPRDVSEISIPFRTIQKAVASICLHGGSIWRKG